MIGELIKWLVCFVAAFLLMPFIIAAMSFTIIQYWSGYLFGASNTFLHLAVQSGPLGVLFTIFWIVWAVGHLVFAFNWWFLRD